MATALRALIVEDNEEHAILLERELTRGGYDLTSLRVDTPEDMEAALENQPWDIVLSDYSMPRFSAQAALSLVKDKGLDLPFIIISGTIGEEAAVAALRAGAHDFLVKGALARLLPAIDRELREAAMRAERERMHEQLLISERMVSVGTLAAGVAHEINNPLAILLANLELAIQHMTEIADSGRSHGAAPDADAGGDRTISKWLIERLGDVARPLREAQDAAERVRLIARDLKVFSRAGEQELRGPVDIHAVLESAIRMASNEIRHRAKLVKDYGDVPLVEGNESRLGQIFLNLIVNAAQSIPDGRAQENEIRICTRRDDAGGVGIEIRDTGAGIPQSVLPRIFDPFFTTKSVGIGTGLGLAICLRIVADLNGKISVESQVGAGSVFRVVLPQSHAVTPKVQPNLPEPVGEQRRGRVLVVDDEQAICGIIEQFLADLHEVTAVTKAREALQLIHGGERFDLILCDLMMPEMTGIDLHAALLASAPEQARKIIFMTGGAFTQNAQTFLDQVPNAFIEKPFTGAALRQVVQSFVQ